MYACKVIGGVNHRQELSEGEKDLLRDIFAKKFKYDEEKLFFSLSLMDDMSIESFRSHLGFMFDVLNRTESKIISAMYGVGMPRIEKESMIPEAVDITEAMFKLNKRKAISTLKKIREWQYIDELFQSLRLGHEKALRQMED